MKRMPKILLAVCLLFCMASLAKAQEDTFDHSRFYQAKNAVRHELIETVKQIGFTGKESAFKDELDKRLSKSASKNPGMDYTVLTSKMDDAILIITLIGYDDEKGFVGWKFDTIVVDNVAYFFSITLSDRQIPELGPEDYYQWHRMKKG